MPLFETHGTGSSEQSAIDFDAVLCRVGAHQGQVFCPGYDPVAALEMLNAEEDGRTYSLRHVAQAGWTVDRSSGVQWHEGWAL